MTNIADTGAAAEGAGIDTAWATPGATMQTSAMAFTATLDALETAAPAAGPSSLNDWMGQAQSALSAAFDPEMTQIPQNASVVETYQHLARIHTQVSGGQQLMAALHMVANKLHKVAETLLPRTG